MFFSTVPDDQIDYIANILQQRERFSPQPSPLHLTRRQDLLGVELEQPDLSVYEGSDTIPIVPKSVSGVRVFPLPIRVFVPDPNER